LATRKPLTDRAKAAIEEVALAAALPDGVTDAIMICESTPGAKLPNGDPSGVGGTTKFGVAWVLRGRETSAPVALYDTHAEAACLYEAITGPEGELWQRKARRRALIQELEETEKSAAAEAKATLKAQNDGAGSPRPKRSSEKRSTRPSKRSERAAS
jgi:hypothetical protein